MEYPLYFLDSLVLASLASAVFTGLLILFRRASVGKGKRPDSVTIVCFIFVACLLLHAWGQFRPVPVLVETTRLMTDSEKARYGGRGLPVEMLAGLQITERKPFDGSNAAGWSWVEVGKLKRLLVWRGIWPRLPKEIILREKGFPLLGISLAEAGYNRVGSIRKVINFDQRDGKWAIKSICYADDYGPASTNFLDEVISYVPVSLRIY